MEKQLPKNWVEVQLLDILQTLENGSRPKGGVQGILEGVPSLGGEHLNSDGGFKFGNLKYVPEVFANKMNKGLIKENDILIVKDGATTGKTSFVDNKFPFKLAFVNEHVFISRTYSDINSKVIFYFLYSKLGQERILDNFTGSAQGGINQKFANNTLIPLPPLAEQNRIVVKLDVLFTQLETIKTSMAKIPLLLKDFRQQVLTQAVTGKLTEEWRKDKKDQKWRAELLNNICISITDGDHQAPPQVSEGVPFLVISNVSKGSFDFDKVSRFVPKEYFDSLKETRKPKKGDVLYTVTGSYGIPLLVTFEKEFCFQRHIAILRPDQNKISSNFLHILLQSNLILNQAHKVATGTAQLTVSLGGIKKFEIDLPGIEEQREIVKRVESLFMKAGAIDQQYQILKQKIDDLPRSLLHKAFKGELTQQLDSDGDAADLLNQIRDLKNSAVKPKKTILKRR